MMMMMTIVVELPCYRLVHIHSDNRVKTSRYKNHIPNTILHGSIPHNSVQWQKGRRATDRRDCSVPRCRGPCCCSSYSTQLPLPGTVLCLFVDAVLCVLSCSMVARCAASDGMGSNRAQGTTVCSSMEQPQQTAPCRTRPWMSLSTVAVETTTDLQCFTMNH